MKHVELLPIPPIESATEPICSAADMRQRWRALMGPLGFGASLLWLGFVGPDRRMVKTMSQIPMPMDPRQDFVEDVIVRMYWVLYRFEPGTTSAMLMTRPGTGGISARDKKWSTLLTRSAVDHQVPIEPIFRANNESLVQVAP